jgi:hypothetical protein
MSSRRVVGVATPAFGWDHPWPNVFEVAEAFPTDRLDTRWRLDGANARIGGRY